MRWQGEVFDRLIRIDTFSTIFPLVRALVKHTQKQEVFSCCCSKSRVQSWVWDANSIKCHSAVVTSFVELLHVLALKWAVAIRSATRQAKKSLHVWKSTFWSCNYVTLKSDLIYALATLWFKFWWSTPYYPWARKRGPSVWNPIYWEAKRFQALWKSLRFTGARWTPGNSNLRSFRSTAVVPTPAR